MRVLVPVAMGAGMAVFLMALGRGRGTGIPVADVRPSCGVSILLFECKKDSSIVDALTGSLGFSHVALDGCETDSLGRHIIIDCQPGLGVARVPISTYGDRPRIRVWLPLCEGRELYGCVRGRVGSQYDVLGLMMQSEDHGAAQCSQLIFDCLPTRLQDMIPRTSRPVAPNDLARGFGAVPGGPPVVLEGAT